MEAGEIESEEKLEVLVVGKKISKKNVMSVISNNCKKFQNNEYVT